MQAGYRFQKFNFRLNSLRCHLPQFFFWFRNIAQTPFSFVAHQFDLSLRYLFRYLIKACGISRLTVCQSKVVELWTGLDFKELGLDMYWASRLPQSMSIHELAHKSL